MHYEFTLSGDRNTITMLYACKYDVGHKFAIMKNRLPFCGWCFMCSKLKSSTHKHDSVSAISVTT
jgi:hypothetical protein